MGGGGWGLGGGEGGGKFVAQLVLCLITNQC